jgi:hypothetical protein
MEAPPRLLHIINVCVLLLGGALLLTAVNSTAQLIIVAPVPVILALYWRFRARPVVVACCFGMAMSVFAWILLCEYIVLVDRTLGTRISTRLQLDPRLTNYVLSNLPTEDRRELEPCCNDPLMWHYRPGSRYRAFFDCPTCNPPYEAIVDQTGYLNQAPCPPQCYPQIDVFVAGDGVLQGSGVASVVEELRRHIPLRLWNLSLHAYGPRQKIDALLTWAVPHTPRWLVVEFYAGNDLAEAIRDDVCEHDGDFSCRYDGPAVERRLAQHPLYAPMFEVRNDLWTRLADYGRKNLTLATTRYMFDTMKGVLKQPRKTSGAAVARREVTNGSLWRPAKPASPSRGPKLPPSVTQIAIAPWLARAATTPAPVRQGQGPAYVRAGLAVSEHEYERLMTTLAQKAKPPEVILFYNPAPYEVYRLLGMELDPRAEELYPVQREALRIFAQKHVWLYGEYDQSHWSREGTAIVAEVLATELSTILRSND